MAERSPVDSDYLALVSEWESQTPRGGRVGNAYPLLNVTTGDVVEKPREEFANAGAVFLMNRGTLNAWDYILVKPRWNDRYKNAMDRDCCYIPGRAPELLETASQSENIAVVLNHPAFDPDSTSRQLLNPRYNVTPLFFIQKNQSYYGPFIREGVALSSMDDVQRIDWRAAREDGIIYEFTRDEMTLQNLRLVTYTHPEPSLNRVLETPIQFAFGPVLKATSGRPKDALPEAALIDWYLQHCPTVEVPLGILSSMKSAFRHQPTDDPALLAVRLKKIEKEIFTHEKLIEHRDRLAKRYAESEPGKQRVAELLEAAVARRAEEIQAEVDRRDSQLAARREDLARQFAEADREHARRLAELQAQRDSYQRQIDDTRAAVAEVKAALGSDLSDLRHRIRDHLPLIAAVLPTGRDVYNSSSGATVDTGLRPPVFRPVPPTSGTREIESEARLIDDLTSDLALNGLHFARDFIANVYICLKAEPLNLIIGPPGHGKSTLVASLARALGHGEALLRIAVRRSWSEDRHLLGFYDSFHGRYDPGTTGLVPRMLQAAADWRSDRKGIYIVLMDEFNLAAPEYYFSQLLQALPSDEQGRELALYENGKSPDAFPERVAIEPNLRFWGTINYDETTERLSPRTLDRTGMIFLGPADVRPSTDEEPVRMPGVAASDLFDKFQRKPEDCPEDRWEIVSRILDFLHTPDVALGPRIEISPRVRKALKRYLANSTEVLTPKTAADFAVQQRILPVIRGRGDEFLARMRRLGHLLAEASLTRSASHVEEALRRAEQQFGELDLFSY